MSDRKPQNTALLIATLGVYLGLVLAGAAPQILAQAATAKQFNIKDESVIKDGFDGNPDIDELKALITDSLEGALTGFLSDLEKPDKRSAVLSALTSGRTIYSGYFFCPSGISKWGNGADVLQGDPISDIHIALDPVPRWTLKTFPKAIQDQRAGEKCSKAFDLVTRVENGDLTFEFHFSRTRDSTELANYLERYIRDRSTLFVQDPTRNTIYDGTRVAFHQPFLKVITLLPRGSLDALLANGK